MMINDIKVICTKYSLYSPVRRAISRVVDAIHRGMVHKMKTAQNGLYKPAGTFPSKQVFPNLGRLLNDNFDTETVGPILTLSATNPS
jgi:hypothetical protein